MRHLRSAAFLVEHSHKNQNARKVEWGVRNDRDASLGVLRVLIVFLYKL